MFQNLKSPGLVNEFIMPFVRYRERIKIRISQKTKIEIDNWTVEDSKTEINFLIWPINIDLQIYVL